MIRPLLLSLLVVSAVLAADNPIKNRIALVELSALNDDIKAVVLARPENKELKAAANQEKILNAELQSALQSAGDDQAKHQALFQDHSKKMAALGNATQEIQTLVRKALIKHLDANYAGQFAAVFDRDSRDAILSSNAEMVDLTSSIQHALLTDKF